MLSHDSHASNAAFCNPQGAASLFTGLFTLRARRAGKCGQRSQRWKGSKAQKFGRPHPGLRAGGFGRAVDPSRTGPSLGGRDNLTVDSFPATRAPDWLSRKDTGRQKAGK
jgi:hypothetical protein